MSEKAHGIMFHYFHDGKKHAGGQGSISAEQFDKLLDYYEREHNIISAEEFLNKSIHKKLSNKDVCLTFDDGLCCQYEVAYPVMKDRGLTAFWFIYTSPLDGIMEKLEVYRQFRFSQFSDIEDFYSAFFEAAEKMYGKAAVTLEDYNSDGYLKEFPFYTSNDKRFRYMRDVVLGEKKYNSLMDSMIKEYEYDINESARLLWLNSNNIKELHQQGHIIGLHSYSHPTVMTNKDYEGQRKEYYTNKIHLEGIIGESIYSVSYPCDSYNIDTLNCMKELGITIGFKANMTDIYLENIQYEYPREDHANIIKKMEDKK